MAFETQDEPDVTVNETDTPTVNVALAVLLVHSAVLALLLALSGCAATDAYVDPGWRYGVIEGIGGHAGLAPTADQDCGGSLGPDSPYVVARYSDGGHGRSIGKLQRPADSSLQVGQEVRVNVLDCNAAFIPLDAARRTP